MIKKVPIRDAAELLHLAPDTIRRKLRAGELSGEKVMMGKVSTWLVYLDERQGNQPREVRPENSEKTKELYKARIQELERDRDAWRDQAIQLLEVSTSLSRARNVD